MNFYAPRDLTRYRVPVLVHWRGRAFKGYKAFDRRARSYCWFTLVDGIEVRLDVPGTRRPDEPTAWSPLGGWPGPLPEPLPPAFGTGAAFTGDGVQIGRRAMARAALAAEREAAAHEDVPDQVGRYSMAPSIPLAEIEARLVRAIRTEGVAIERRLRKGRSVASWPPELVDLLRADADPGRVPGAVPYPRWVGTPADVTDADLVMAWFVAINPPAAWRPGRVAWSLSVHQKVLVWRARRPPWSYAEIGADIRRSKERARQIYREAVERVWRVANGLGRAR